MLSPYIFVLITKEEREKKNTYGMKFDSSCGFTAPIQNIKLGLFSEDDFVVRTEIFFFKKKKRSTLTRIEILILISCP